MTKTIILVGLTLIAVAVLIYALVKAYVFFTRELDDDYQVRRASERALREATEDLEHALNREAKTRRKHHS